MPHSIKTGINAAKTTNQPFQMIWKGSEIQLLIGQIKTDEIEEARKALDQMKKGLSEIKGKCSYDPTAKKIVFFSSAAPTAPTFPTKIKAYIGKFASITFDADNVILTKKKTDLLFSEADDGQTAKSTNGQAPSPDQPQKENGVPEAPPVGDLEQQEKFRNRLQQLSPLYVKAIQAMPDSRVGLEQLSKKATDLANSGNYADAFVQLDAWEKGIKTTLQAAVGRQGESKEKVEDTDVKEVSNVVFTQSRLLWDSARKKVLSDLQLIQTNLMEICKKVNENPDAEYEIDLPKLATQAQDLFKRLEPLDTRLMDKLDEALNAKDKPTRKAKHREAAVIVKEYLQFANESDLITDIDQSGFAPTKIRETVLGVLNGLASKL